MAAQLDSGMTSAVLKDSRSFRPFKSSEEYLYAMKEDLAEWLNTLYSELDISVDNFMEKLETGVAICKHANTVREAALQFLERRGGRSPRRPSLGAQCAPLLANMGRVKYRGTAQAGTFFARDNVSNFIAWCRQGLDIMECLLFETDDLCLRKNEKHVILCLLEVARRGARLGMPAPVLVQMEREIDRELAAEQRAMAPNNAGSDFSDEEDVTPISIPQIVTNDLKSLDEMVRDLVERCKCPVQFPMIRVSEGKYRIGDTKVLIFVRILRKHVMVRVGGGWDTLSHYLDKHDPCRCKTAHRSPINAKLVLKSGGANMDLGSAHVYYERSPPRTRRSSASSVGSTGGGGGGNVNMASLIPAPSQAGGGGRRNRSRSRSPTHAPALRPPSFRSSTHCLVQEPSATPTDTPLNDSSSEVSDEGYRSLGPLVMTPQSSTHILDVNTPLNTNANNLEHHSAVLLHPPSECSSNKFPSDEISMTNTVENERPTINSLSTVGSTICINHLDNVSLKQSKSRSSSIDSSESRRLPRTHITVPTQDRSRRTSHSPARSTASTKSQGRPNSGGETTIISSISPKKMAADKNLSPKHNYGESSSASSSLSKATGKQPSGPNNNNTWNGRPGKSKVRPSLTPNTFDNKNNCGLSPRNTFQRKSLGSYGSSHSIPSKISNQRPIKKNSLPASLQTSPTKQISPLLEQILQVNDLNNDENILSKMKEIIQHYSSIVDEKLVEEKKYESAVAEPPNDDGLDFTSAWVHGNGSLEGIQQHHTTRQKESCENKIFDEESSSECSKTGGLKTGPSPRKDSKAEGSMSKIPAPTFFRSQMTNDQQPFES